MKNKDILLDVIGDTDEKLVPELTAKMRKSSILKVGALVAIVLLVVSVGALIINRSSYIFSQSQTGNLIENDTISSQNQTGKITDESSTNDITMANTSEPMDNDVIVWNDFQLLNTDNRLAANFIEIRKEEWVKYYDVELSGDYEMVYKLAYAVPKPDDNNSDTLMCGFIGLRLSEKASVDIYIDDNPFQNANNFFVNDFNDEQLVNSQINGKKIYLGENGVNRCAVFTDGKYSYYITMYNMDDEQSVKLLEDIVK